MVADLALDLLRRHASAASAALRRAIAEAHEDWYQSGIRWSDIPPPGSQALTRLASYADALPTTVEQMLRHPDQANRVSFAVTAIDSFYKTIEYDDGLRWSRHWLAWRRVPQPTEALLNNPRYRPDTPVDGLGDYHCPIQIITDETPASPTHEGRTP